MAKYRHEWYQNESRVYVNVFIKKLRTEDVTVDITEHSLNVNVKLPNDDTFELSLNNLGGAVDPSQSGYEVLSTKLEIYLQKKVVGYQWTQLEGSSIQPTTYSTTVKPPTVSSSTGTEHVPSYPSSSKKAKNWDKLAKEAENDDFDKPDGDRALDKLFQQIYQDADEETRRAMMKSFIESNGTCLSTNWDEVGKGKVETKPPEGMTEKKFSA
ncbi:Cochaperone protein [Dispira parvispora]|uniref:Cochaperone protein n=1 Tax=Dispira parvispora TaxID=1520584 RepID=A0A9W8E6S6_9FUNG|nr:Cochaperone protein [Dispira parvispora]